MCCFHGLARCFHGLGRKKRESTTSSWEGQLGGAWRGSELYRSCTSSEVSVPSEQRSIQQAAPGFCCPPLHTSCSRRSRSSFPFLHGWHRRSKREARVLYSTRQQDKSRKGAGEITRRLLHERTPKADRRSREHMDDRLANRTARDQHQQQEQSQEPSTSAAPCASGD